MTFGRRGIAALLVSCIASTSAAESVTWEAAAVAPGKERQVLAGGIKVYSPAKDILVQEAKGEDGGRPYWEKSLLLDNNFALTARVFREARLDGFGLVIYRRGDRFGFSWEWFDRQEGSVFQKLQGPGRISVTVKKGPGYEELESVEFLDDMVLRYLDSMNKPPGTHTHEVLIRKGSVFRCAP